MSDVDEDFMCEDDEDYGLVRRNVEIVPLMAFHSMSAFCFHSANRSILKTATRSRMWILRINITTARR